MSTPNTLIFFDIGSSDPTAAGAFYEAVLGWRNDPRPEGLYHRMVPGGFFRNPDGSDSQIGNLHMGIFNCFNARPHPEPDGVAPRDLSSAGRKPRVWVLISDDDSAERILARARDLGASILWQNHYWAEFNGYNHAFADPWGNEIVLWQKAGANPRLPLDFTRE